MAQFYSCAQAQADGLTTTAGLATSGERIATMTIRVRQDEAQGPKERSCPFLGLHTRGHKVNLDHDSRPTCGREVKARPGTVGTHNAMKHAHDRWDNQW
jgi:hypothetical protein